MSFTSVIDYNDNTSNWTSTLGASPFADRGTVRTATSGKHRNPMGVGLEGRLSDPFGVPLNFENGVSNML